VKLRSRLLIGSIATVGYLAGFFWLGYLLKG